MKYANMIALALIIIGGLNWGLVGLFDWNLVAAIFGEDSWFSNLIYVLVGLAALWSFVLFKPLSEDPGPRGTRAAPPR